MSEKSPTTADDQVLARQVAAAQEQLDYLRHQLTESQRLATIGTIAAVIAHEFNNLLTPIVSYSQFALQSAESQAPDMALIKKTEAADTGDIVVALIDDEEATLKRFRRRGASIALEPANTSYEVRILPPNRVRIQGKLIGLYRKY